MSTRSGPSSLFVGGDCASRGSDACKVAALPSSSCQCFVDNVPVLGSVDSVQDDRACRAQRAWADIERKRPADVDAVRADHFHVLGDLVRGHLVSTALELSVRRIWASVLSVWFGIGGASSGCGSIFRKRLAAGVRVVVMRARSPPPGALRAACPGRELRPTSREAARP